VNRILIKAEDVEMVELMHRDPIVLEEKEHGRPKAAHAPTRPSDACWTGGSIHTRPPVQAGTTTGTSAEEITSSEKGRRFEIRGPIRQLGGGPTRPGDRGLSPARSTIPPRSSAEAVAP
jgi:hypothetical protein